MIFWKVKAKVKWFVKVQAKEKSIDLIKSQKKYNEIWVNYFQFDLHYDRNFENKCS